LKVLYLTNSFPEKEAIYDGIFNLRRVEKLVENGIYVEVVNYNNMIQKKKLSFKKSYNLNQIGFDIDLFVHKINYFKLPVLKRHLIKKIRTLFFKKKFDLVHSHFVWNGYLCYLLKKKYDIPYVVTVHGSDIHTEPFKSEKNRDIALKTLKNADKVIFVSKYLLEKSREFGYNGENYVIISNGIDADKFKIIPPEENKFGSMKKSGLTVGFVGGLDPVKRVDKFPSIFSRIAGQKDEIKFLIVGDGILRKPIEDEFKALGIDHIVTITGNVHPDDVPHHINNMDVMILPSLREGFPCVVMESFACGVPVVGSNNGGIPEAVGDCGILVDDGEEFEKRFGDAVLKMLDLNADKSRMLDRAQSFSWSNLVKKEISVYREIEDRKSK
jgi:teichuronic acid biosynthesis glycosyltransferase TuaC